jgi:hypothetical protein
MTETDLPDSTTLMRHAIATLAYRASRVLTATPSGFEGFDAGQGVMTPKKMLNHMSTILAYAHAQLMSEDFQRPTEVDEWSMEVDRFFETLTLLDRAVESGMRADADTVLRMLQGPMLDVATHIGQLSMLRRLAGSPTPKDHYIKAAVTIGRTGKDQPPPARLKAKRVLRMKTGGRPNGSDRPFISRCIRVQAGLSFRRRRRHPTGRAERTVPAGP